MQHPIENIMASTMENIKEMVDVNTVVGDPVVTGDGSTIIPISRVCFGFVVGGGEYGETDGKKQQNGGDEGKGFPFGGGSGAGVTVHPMGFLVINKDQVKMLPAQYYATTVDRVIELVPQLLSDAKKWFCESGEQEQPKQMAPSSEL